MSNQPVGFIRLGKNLYAAGLFWQAAPNQSQVKRMVGILASQAGIDADLYCIRRGQSVQFGLGRGAAGHKPGMIAVAACLADKISGNWIGLFKTPQGYLFVAVRKGQVMPDGDALFKDEAEAIDRLRTDLAIGNWDEVFAPQNLGFTESKEIILEEILIGNKGPKLASLKLPASFYLFAFLAMAIGGFGYWLFFIKEPEPEKIKPLVQAPMPPPLTPVIEENPPEWIGKPHAIDVVNFCEDNIQKEVVSLPGYVLASVFCAGNSVDMTYTRTYGKVSWLQHYPIKGNINILSESNAVISIPLNRTYKLLPDIKQLQAYPDIQKMIWDRTQYTGIDVQYSEIRPPPPPEGQEPVPPKYRKFYFEISSSYVPRKSFTILQEIYPITVKAVSFDAPSREWKISGSFYLAN
ncbi:MAG: type 4b pilus protein PilO2 [Alphaproteobacteria bacterium]